MPLYLYTFRPQICDQNLFETFIDIFLPFIEEFPRYSYSIEEDGTLSKHIHILYDCKASDNSKALPQKLNRKMFSKFHSVLKNKMTNEIGFDDRKVLDTKEDQLKVLGYVNKAEKNLWRRGAKGFPLEEISEAIKYYYAEKHLDKSIYKSDLRILQSRTIHISVLEYCVSNTLEPTDPLTKIQMIKEGMMFSQVGHVAETLEEVEINMFPERFDTTKKDKSYNNLTYANAQLQRENDRQEQIINALKKRFNIGQVDITFNGVVRIKGKGSDEEYQEI